MKIKNCTIATNPISNSYNALKFKTRLQIKTKNTTKVIFQELKIGYRTKHEQWDYKKT